MQCLCRKPTFTVLYSIALLSLAISGNLILELSITDSKARHCPSSSPVSTSKQVVSFDLTWLLFQNPTWQSWFTASCELAKSENKKGWQVRKSERGEKAIPSLWKQSSSAAAAASPLSFSLLWSDHAISLVSSLSLLLPDFENDWLGSTACSFIFPSSPPHEANQKAFTTQVGEPLLGFVVRISFIVSCQLTNI